MFNRIAFGGTFSKYFYKNIMDLSKREFCIIGTLCLLTLVLGIYPSPLIDVLNYPVSGLIYNT